MEIVNEHDLPTNVVSGKHIIDLWNFEMATHHYAVKLLIRFKHLKLFHAGTQTVLANLRLRYWIIHGMERIKSVVNECVICHRLKAKRATQFRGALPPDRVSIAREPLTGLPEKDVSNVTGNKLSFSQFCNEIKQNFWKRWSTEYLTKLQSRSKWFKHGKNLKENDMVLLKEDNVPPLHWSLGRNVQVMPGSDGTIRVITKLKLKTEYLQGQQLKSVLYRLNPILKAVEAATSRGGEYWEMSK
ncbi:hypothetical protein D910_00923 [Dendroctonus ponderosae]|uniref:DUF5641 domain-containing protein n=1 Tax=Dendroctonus ponderosae TaxID=77166 RepID=U4V054_DENPD|nr:hypothetical protein D910_00923 [Dendroctonus ponderosae]